MKFLVEMNKRIWCSLFCVGLLLLFSCDETPPAPALSKVDTIFMLAKQFSQGENNALLIKDTYESLSADELKELRGKKEGLSDFAMFMVLGKASLESNQVVEKYIGPKDEIGSVKNTIRGNLLLDGAANKNRYEEEPKKEKDQLIALIVKRYPDRINRLMTAKGIFDPELFNDVVVHINPPDADTILSKLDHDNLSSFILWALAPMSRPSSEPSFKILYKRVSANHQELMRSLLISLTLHNVQLIKTIIAEADRWGIKDGIGTDTYTLPSTTPATQFHGSLLYVLVRRLLANRALTPSSDLKAFDDVRIVAENMRSLFSDRAAYVSYVTASLWGDQAVKESIEKVVEKALGTNNDAFAHYYLAFDEPKIYSMRQAILS